MSLLDANPVYKPFRYPWAYEAWLTQQRLHWLPEEVPLADDVKDWNRTLSAAERNLLTQIFRFFTQSDVEVNTCYMKHYARVFQPTEVQMMLAAFSNMETVHIAAYAHLLDTLGMPESEYSAFLGIKAMKDKYDYLQRFGSGSKRDLALTLAVFGAFTEGLQLFGSFAILLNFPRFGKMKGMGQIVSCRCATRRSTPTRSSGCSRLSWRRIRRSGPRACATISATPARHHRPRRRLHRSRLRDGRGRGPGRADVKCYLRAIADRRLAQLGLAPLYRVESNPLPGSTR